MGLPVEMGEEGSLDPWVVDPEPERGQVRQPVPSLGLESRDDKHGVSDAVRTHEGGRSPRPGVVGRRADGTCL